MRAIVQSADAGSARAWLVQQQRRRYARASFFRSAVVGPKRAERLGSVKQFEARCQVKSALGRFRKS